jgi:uncharacterized protein (TIGR02996 family)
VQPEELDFLSAIYANAKDDSARFVYADWLEDRSDSRGDFLRLEVELNRLGAGTKTAKARALRARLGRLQSEIDNKWVGRILRTRHFHDSDLVDLVRLDEGTGRIEVRGGGGETALLVDGKRIALNWDDCAGSIGQYLVFSGEPPNLPQLRRMNALIAGDVQRTTPLSEQVLPLLKLFVPGVYCVGYSEAVGQDVLGVNEIRPASGELSGYYPFDDARNLICTQLPESLNEERIDHYQRQLRAERRPTVLTAAAEHAFCEFVIDGHHKLQAYTREGLNAAVLCIARWDAPAITVAEGLQFLPPGSQAEREYRRMKKSHDRR